MNGCGAVAIQGEGEEKAQNGKPVMAGMLTGALLMLVTLFVAPGWSSKHWPDVSVRCWSETIIRHVFSEKMPGERCVSCGNWPITARYYQNRGISGDGR